MVTARILTGEILAEVPMVVTRVTEEIQATVATEVVVPQVVQPAVVPLGVLDRPGPLDPPMVAFAPFARSVPRFGGRTFQA